MNKKVFRVMIGLVVVFLLTCYILKIFFPEQFVMVIQNRVAIQIGDYIDTHKWLEVIVSAITSFLTYFLYICAVNERWCINWKELIAILITIGLIQGFYELDTSLSSGISLIAFFIIPAISKAKLVNVATVFSVHYVSQLLSTLIRGLPLLLTHINSIIILSMTFECYFWLLLFYFYFNYKRGKKKDEV